MKTLRKRFNRFAQKLCMSDRFAAFWKCKNLRILALFVITAQLVLMESQDDFYEEVSNFFCCINGFHIYALLASPGKMLHGAERLSLVSVYLRIFLVFYIDIVKEIPIQTLKTEELIDEKHCHEICIHLLPPVLNMLWIDVAHSVFVFALIAAIVSLKKREATATITDHSLQSTELLARATTIAKLPAP